MLRGNFVIRLWKVLPQKPGDKFIASDVMNWLLVDSEFERYPALLPENNDVR